MENLKTKKRIRIGILALLVICVGAIAAFYIYSLDYYRASPEVDQLIQENKNRFVETDKMTMVYPNPIRDRNVGLIFYPGGKVEAKAYLPLLEQLAEEGVTCVLVEMPFNLAVFDTDAAEKAYHQLPEIERWILAGHSLGGAMASSYVEKNSEKLDGLILLGAYPINDEEIDTLVIYGSEDIQLDLTKLETVENKVEILGGNHAYFGNYGEQEGDGVAVISREEQQAITVEKILGFIEA